MERQTSGVNNKAKHKYVFVRGNYTPTRATHYYSSHTGKQLDFMPGIFVATSTFPRRARAIPPSGKTRQFGPFSLSANIHICLLYTSPSPRD